MGSSFYIDVDASGDSRKQQKRRRWREKLPELIEDVM